MVYAQKCHCHGSLLSKKQKTLYMIFCPQKHGNPMVLVVTVLLPLLLCLSLTCFSSVAAEVVVVSVII